MTTILDEILTATRARLARHPIEVDQAEALARPRPPSFRDALTAPGLSIIAEIKRRSPSAGPLAPELDPVARATEYALGRASAISVLTEPEFFSGSLSDMTAVASAVELPVLRKDFVVDASQIWEARAGGAAAVLLIVSAHTDEDLAQLIHVAGVAGLDALVEVHTEVEAERALAAGSEIVGVNNRNLATFETDLTVAERLAPYLDGAVRVAESGVSDPAGSARMARAGYDAVLVGEALVTAADPAALVAALKGAAS
ncbi:MAG: indole-3-glycerol phosphate synthase TrpC [Acidimicrobiia bacterium]|nr:indole-3-glycerol phosphate synthase TrpC [Acidimicrobiia bacterium]